jgi:hypothetical protein
LVIRTIRGNLYFSSDSAKKKGRVSYSPTQHHEELFENRFSRAAATDQEQFRVSTIWDHHYVEVFRFQ